MDIMFLVKQKIERLIDVMLTDGVQPSDITENIFLREYKQIICKTVENNIICEILLSDTKEDLELNYIMRYYYTLNKRIIRIEEEHDNNIIILWDREITESNLINDVIDLLKTQYDESSIQGFVDTLPTEISQKIYNVICSVA